jgi:hypothetical protein
MRRRRAPFSIGRFADEMTLPTFWDGHIDDVRVWRVVRSAAQIATNRARKLAGNEADLVGYWPLDGTYEDRTGGGPALVQTNENGVTLAAFSPEVPFP